MINLDFFNQNGFFIIRDFYSKSDTSSIIESISDLIKIKAKNIGINYSDDPNENLKTTFMNIVAYDRKIGSVIYDAVKQLPDFIRLVSNKKNEELYKFIRKNSIVGIAKNGDGVRIDIPGEDKFLSPWHQEFPAQLRSLDGIVFWTPLVNMNQNLGPVEVAIGSHKEGVKPIYKEEGKQGAYAFRIKNDKIYEENYVIESPLLNIGDLIVFDFLTVHRSGINRSTHPRWSIQFRYFNYLDPLGQKIDWIGSVASGIELEKIIPSIVEVEA